MKNIKAAKVVTLNTRFFKLQEQKMKENDLNFFKELEKFIEQFEIKDAEPTRLLERITTIMLAGVPSFQLNSFYQDNKDIKLFTTAECDQILNTNKSETVTRSSFAVDKFTLTKKSIGYEIIYELERIRPFSSNELLTLIKQLISIDQFANGKNLSKTWGNLFIVSINNIQYEIQVVWDSEESMWIIGCNKSHDRKMLYGPGTMVFTPSLLSRIA